MEEYDTLYPEYGFASHKGYCTPEHLTALAAHGPSTLWYATRGAGAVSLVLLTLSVALGVAETRMWAPARAPRFTIAALHRSLSLLALAFLVLHIVTVVLDPFPPIGVLNAVVPFVTSYRANNWLANARKTAKVTYPTPLKNLLPTSGTQ